MKKLPVILLFLFAGIAATAQQRALRYSFTYDTLLAKPRMLVTVSFRGDSSGHTELLLPDAWASQKELYKAVSHLEAVTPGVRIDTTADPTRRMLQHAPGAELTLAYELRQDWSGSFVYPKNYRAVLQRTWMQSTGYALLVKPSWDKDAQVAL
ncbi:MAG: hypothetical protein EOO11_23600, partial [Chitinophagaceae bacterium]